MAVPYYNWLLTVYEDRELRKAQRRRIRDVCDPFDLPDVEFQVIWRINKTMATYLVDRLAQDLEPRGNGLPAHIKVLLSIQLLANGGYQRQLGMDHSMCEAQTTASKFIMQFVAAVYRRLFAEWVHFPATEAARSSIAREFELKHQIPGILGLIDCTHIKIFPPPGPQGAQYKNRRKAVHTINVQLISDADCRIINVNARFPGRVHDAFIWHQSVVKEEMRQLHARQISQYFLLGDSGYPLLEPWLMTPVLHTEPGTPEQRYTDWHTHVRNGIEHTNGYLKGSLRCLGIDRVLHYAPEKATQIIYAACVVYNLMKHFGVPLEQDERPDDVIGEGEMPPVRLLQLAQAKRSHLIETYFR